MHWSFSYPPIKFVGDIVISAAIVVMVLAGVWWFVSTLGGLIILMIAVAPIVLAALVVFSFGPGVAFLFVGLVSKRFGLVLGPILVMAAWYGHSSHLQRQQDDIIAKLRADTARLTSDRANPVRTDHTLLAIDGDAGSCDWACIPVLATSNHTLALRERYSRDRNWSLYTQASGPTCLEKENAKLALEFLLRGFPGKCATQKPIADFDDGLWLRIANTPRGLAPSDFPKGFDRTIYEYSERLDGHDHLLARRIRGSFPYEPLSTFWCQKRPPHFDAGPPIDKESFLANAIGSDIASLRNPVDPFPFDEVLTGIEQYFDQKEAIGAETFRYAGSAWSQIAANASRPQSKLLKEHILRMFASNDPFRIELGLDVVWSLPPGERTFPDDVMLDLMFVPIDGQASSTLQKQLERQFAPGRTPPASAVRDRAKAHLGDPDLAPWKLRLLKQISEF